MVAMGKAPAVILIARHGARLDAEDTNWTLNSPTPYDPPLTYGGWTQTRALGARVASILHARELSLNEDDHGGGKRHGSHTSAGQPTSAEQPRSSHRSRRRKHKIVIHSSPFLRCVQSSIAISAGIAQYRGNLAKFERQHQQHLPPSGARTTGGPARSHTLDPKSFDSKYERPPTVEAQQAAAARAASRMHSEFSKITLRIDACLGEWLSTDYFEHIAPPPSSSSMISGAKIELLRAQTPVQSARMPGDPSFDRLDEAAEPHSGRGKAAFSTSELVESLNEVASSSGDGSVKSSAQGKIGALQGYTPPTPLYSITASEPIPRGFVAHARDACVKIDYQWESMRAPQNWGDGGEFGEEWRSMHRRFRRGITNMVSWYKENGADRDPQDPESSRNGDVPEEEELVLVIVTHGAGANALIGALTNQPVLIDVGMASLTMAVRKTTTTTRRQSQSQENNGTPLGRRRSSMDNSLPDEYDMRLTASTDHLRAGADPLKIPQLQSPKLMPSIPEYGLNQGSSGSSGAVTPVEIGSPRSRNAALGSIRRPRAATSRTSSYTASPLNQSPVRAGGLWGSRQNSFDQSDAHHFTLQDGGSQLAALGDQSLSTGNGNGSSNSGRSDSRSGSGLWGDAQAEKRRASATTTY